MLVGAVLSVGLSGQALAQAWDMPTPYPDSTFHTQNVRQFADDVAKATDGKLTINVHSNGSLFKHPEIKNAVRGGQVPIGEFLLSNIANENPVYGVDSVPFLATDYDAAYKLWDASREQVAALLDREGLMPLYAVAWPPQGLYSNKELKSVDDLRGMRFRAYNPATSRIAELTGAVPTQIEVPDLPQAFTTGRVDAMMTSASTGAGAKAWDFVKHYYDVQAWLPKNVIVVNKRAFQRLDEPTQKAVLEAAKKAEARGREMSEAEMKEKNAMLKDNGMTVQPPGDELRAGLAKIGEQMSADWVKQAGKDGEAILEAYGK
jgi:TRAP-type C4-dicarboxylate transport system substrate-binding protein